MLRKIVSSGTPISCPTFQGTKIVTTPWLPDSPLLITGTHVRKGHCIGTRDTFADIGATVYEYLTGKQWREGSSFLREIWED